jgi:Arc/MetJ family transcription regulator
MGRAKTPTESVVTALVGLRRARQDDPGDLRSAVRQATDELNHAISGQDSYSKTFAARLLGVSPQTLDTWVERGLLPVVQTSKYKRERIPAEMLIALATEVAELREMGRRRGLLPEAITRLEERDPDTRKELDRLRHQAKRPFDRSKYVSARPGPDWHPED